MSDSIRLHPKHGIAPALTFCRICGGECNEIALLGSKADRVLQEVHKASGGTHGSADGYREYGFNRIPSQEPCEGCKSHLDGGGCFIIADDTGEYLRLSTEEIEHLHGKVVDAKNRAIDFKACAGKIITIPVAFWYVDGDNIKLRDPKEWTV